MNLDNQIFNYYSLDISPQVLKVIIKIYCRCIIRPFSFLVCRNIVVSGIKVHGQNVLQVYSKYSVINDSSFGKGWISIGCCLYQTSRYEHLTYLYGNRGRTMSPDDRNKR